MLVANALLGVAVLLSLPTALLVADARHAAGADAMGMVVVPMLLAPRWLAIAAALAIASWRSTLGWIHPRRGPQAAMGIAWHALAGMASFASVLAAYGPHSAAFKPWAFVLAVVVPLLAVAGTAASLNGWASTGAAARRSWRIAAGLVSLVVAAGGVAMARVEFADARRARAAHEAAEVAGERWRAEQQRKLDALSPEEPLRAWLPWLGVSHAEFREPALAAVRGRRALDDDLARMLRDEEDGPLALKFLWLWMPDTPASLAAPALDAIARLPTWAERELSRPPAEADGALATALPDEFPPPVQVDLSDMAQASIVIADRFRGSGLDFVTPIRAFADVLDRHALPEDQLGSDRTYQPRAYLRQWLDARGR